MTIELSDGIVEVLLKQLPAMTRNLQQAEAWQQEYAAGNRQYRRHHVATARENQRFIRNMTGYIEEIKKIKIQYDAQYHKDYGRLVPAHVNG